MAELSDNPSPVVVLESFGPPHGRNNPYFLQLWDSFPSTVIPRYFSWREALLGSYDVFHLHWPEVAMQGRNPARTVARSVLFTLLLLRLRLQHRALVRTLHNLSPHEPVARLQRPIMRLTDRWTTAWITLSDRIEAPTDVPTFLIPHGHYRDWFDGIGLAEPVAGRIAFVGRIRRYKGVESLLSAFRGLPERATLHVVGRSEDAELAATLQHAAAVDPRIAVLDDFVPDPDLAREVRESELVVLPFVELTNSGSMLLALSLDRPVLVPRRPVTEELHDEVGPGWVHLLDGDLDAAALGAALDAAHRHRPAGSPDLSRRAWSPIGHLHEAAFRAARALARPETHA